VSLSAIPPNWVASTVQDLFDIVGGGTPSTVVPEYWSGSIPWITSADIDEDHHVTPHRFITEEAIRASATNKAPSGSVIVVTRVGLGKVGIAPSDLCFSQDSQALIFNQGFLYPHYVLFFMGQAVSIFKHISRGTTISGVTKKQLATVQFLLPPLGEQRRIVAEIEKQFTRLDAAVAALKRAHSNLKRYRAAVLKAAFEGRLVPTEAELARKEGRGYETGEQLLARILKDHRAKWEADQLTKLHTSDKPPKNDNWKKKYRDPARPETFGLPSLPEGWTWATLDQLSSLITSGSRGWAEFYAAEGSLFIRAQDIKTDKLVLADVAHVKVPDGAEGERTRVFSKDLLITITGANVTKTAVADVGSDEAYVSQHVGLVRPLVSDASAYLYFWIVSPAHGRRILEKAAYGAGKPGLNLDNLRELPVALPPLEEQHRVVDAIASQISLLDDTEINLRQGTHRAERLRQSILKHAFRGKLAPQDSNDEPASVLLERIHAERTAKTNGSPNPRRKTRRPVAVGGTT
jgi:type I restriction enzyme, S subunit